LRCALIWSGCTAQLSEANEEMGRCLREMGGSGDSNNSQKYVSSLPYIVNILGHLLLKI